MWNGKNPCALWNVGDFEINVVNLSSFLFWFWICLLDCYYLTKSFKSEFFFNFFFKIEFF